MVWHQYSVTGNVHHSRRHHSSQHHTERGYDEHGAKLGHLGTYSRLEEIHRIVADADKQVENSKHQQEYHND